MEPPEVANATRILETLQIYQLNKRIRAEKVLYREFFKLSHYKVSHFTQYDRIKKDALVRGHKVKNLLTVIKFMIRRKLKNGFSVHWAKIGFMRTVFMSGNRFCYYLLYYDNFVYRLNDTRFQYVLARWKLIALFHTHVFIRILLMRILILRFKDFSLIIQRVLEKEYHVNLSEICVSC